MPKLTVNSTIAEIADAYSTDSRTIYRWITAGVPVHKPEKVSVHLLRQKNPSPLALAACQKLISSNP